MEPTCRIDSNVLTRHVKGTKPMAKAWIKQAISAPGSLTRTAKRAGKTVSQMVANPPKNASTKTKKRIALAKTLAKLRKKRTSR